MEFMPKEAGPGFLRAGPISGAERITDDDDAFGCNRAVNRMRRTLGWFRLWRLQIHGTAGSEGAASKHEGDS